MVLLSNPMTTGSPLFLPTFTFSDGWLIGTSLFYQFFNFEQKSAFDFVKTSQKFPIVSALPVVHLQQWANLLCLNDPV